MLQGGYQAPGQARHVGDVRGTGRENIRLVHPMNITPQAPPGRAGELALGLIGLAVGLFLAYMAADVITNGKITQVISAGGSFERAPEARLRSVKDPTGEQADCGCA